MPSSLGVKKSATSKHTPSRKTSTAQCVPAAQFDPKISGRSCHVLSCLKYDIDVQMVESAARIGIANAQQPHRIGAARRWFGKVSRVSPYAPRSSASLPVLCTSIESAGLPLPPPTVARLPTMNSLILRFAESRQRSSSRSIRRWPVWLKWHRLFGVGGISLVLRPRRYRTSLRLAYRHHHYLSSTIAVYVSAIVAIRGLYL